MAILVRLYRKMITLEENFAKDHNPFILFHYITSCYGIRYDASSRVFRAKLWLYVLGMVLIGSFSHKVYWSLAHTGHNFSLFCVLSTLWIMVGTVCRSMIFYRPVLVRLERFLSDRSFRGEDESNRTARWLVKRQNNRYLVAVLVTLLLEMGIFVGTNVPSQPDFMLVYNGEPIGGFATQMLYGCVSCYFGSLYIIIFAFIFVILNVFREEMSILVQSFGRIDECFDKYRSFFDGPVRSAAREREFWEELHNLLKMNVQRHVELLENLSEFRSIVGPFSCIQYYGSFVLIAYYCFVMTNFGVTKLTVIYVAFIILLVVESYMFCHSIDIINDLHARIGSTLCELKWHTQLRYSVRFASQYRQIRKSILIILMRTQTPIPFTINGFGMISMGRFVDLMNSSYSFLTLLLQLKRKGY
uniref:Uncharacterized protein n=1 Tax=Anopheles dirus TaxID=7168 RepID=A0A182N2Y0_9DIPT